MSNLAQSPCPACGAKNYDRGRFYALLGLCVYCARDHESARDRVVSLRMQGVVRQRPDGVPCCYPPGHPKKVEALAERIRLKQDLWNKFDAGVDAHEEFRNNDGVNDLQPVVEREYQDVGQTGVEKDGKRWRVRCYWDGKKHNIGSFDVKEDALAAAQSFWRDKLGLFIEQRDQVKFWLTKKGEKKKSSKSKKAKKQYYYDLFDLPYDTNDKDVKTEHGESDDAGQVVRGFGKSNVSEARKHQKDGKRTRSRRSKGTGSDEDGGFAFNRYEFATVGHGFA